MSTDVPHLPAFKMESSGGNSYRIEFDDPVGGYRKAEAESIVARLNALVEMDVLLFEIAATAGLHYETSVLVDAIEKMKAAYAAVLPKGATS